MHWCRGRTLGPGNSIGQAAGGRIRSELFVSEPESIVPSRFRRPVEPLEACVELKGEPKERKKVKSQSELDLRFCVLFFAAQELKLFASFYIPSFHISRFQQTLE